MFDRVVKALLAALVPLPAASLIFELGFWVGGGFCRELLRLRIRQPPLEFARELGGYLVLQIEKIVLCLAVGVAPTVREVLNKPIAPPWGFKIKYSPAEILDGSS